MQGEELYAKGMECLKDGDLGKALEFMEQAVSLERSSLHCSALGVCLARQKGDFKRAISLCKEAIKKDPKNSGLFLNLGRVHLLANQKKEAIRIFSMGLRHSENREIIAELNKIGRRRRPIIPFLERSNPLNKMLGKLFYSQRGSKP
jgi:tetratricopeptide (TPR) repeat protein